MSNKRVLALAGAMLLAAAPGALGLDDARPKDDGRIALRLVPESVVEELASALRPAVVERPYVEDLQRVTVDVQLATATTFYDRSSGSTGEKTGFLPTVDASYGYFVYGWLSVGPKLTSIGSLDKDQKFGHFALNLDAKLYYLGSDWPLTPFAGPLVGLSVLVDQTQSTNAANQTTKKTETSASWDVGATAGFDVPLNQGLGITVEYRILYSPHPKFDLLENGLLFGITFYF